MGRWTLLDGRAPECPGLYCIRLDGRIAYIGQSRNLRQRIWAYSLGVCRRQGVFRGVRFRTLTAHIRPFSGPGRLDLERRLIARLRPERNTTHVPRPEPEPLDEPRFEPTYTHGMHLPYG